MTFDFPKMRSQGSNEKDISYLRKFLYQLVEKLNLNRDEMSAAASEQSEEAETSSATKVKSGEVTVAELEARSNGTGSVNVRDLSHPNTNAAELHATTSGDGELVLKSGSSTSTLTKQKIDKIDSIDGLSTTVTTLSQSVSGMSQTVASHGTSISSLGDRVDGMETNISALESSVSDLEDSCITETGTFGSTFCYRKWADGTSEAWGYIDISNKACSTASGSWYFTADITQSISFPTGLFKANSAPVRQIHFASKDGTPAVVWDADAYAILSSGTRTLPTVKLARPTSATISGRLFFRWDGVWK